MSYLAFWVPRTGLEPARLSTLAPETSASTIPPPGLGEDIWSVAPIVFYVGLWHSGYIVRERLGMPDRCQFGGAKVGGFVELSKFFKIYF